MNLFTFAKENMQNEFNQIRTVDTEFKRVGYYYPSSPGANFFGFGKTGCYGVEIEGKHSHLVKGFSTKTEACMFAASLPHELSPYSL